MMLPSNISNIMIQHLSLSHDEHSGIMLQHNNANAATDSALKQTRTQINNTSASNLLRSQGNDRHHCVSNLNSLPVQNNSLRLQTNRDSTSGKLVTVKPVNNDRNRDKGQSGTEQTVADIDSCLAELLEIQALKTVVETSQTLQASRQYESLFVSLLYIKKVSDVSQLISQGQLMTVSALEAENGRIVAHSTLVVPGANGEMQSKHMHSQIISGHPVNSHSWIMIDMKRHPMMKEVSWKLTTSGSYDDFSGIAVITGKHHWFQHDMAHISVHVPGAIQQEKWLC